jgi:glucose-1-phosphatase
VGYFAMSSNDRADPCAIRCVCFDWGGVIMRHCHSWQEACAHAGIESRDGMDDPDRKQQRRTLTEWFRTGKISERDFFPQLALATGGIYTIEEVTAIHNAWLIDEYAGVGEIIDAINATDGLETAVLSNTNASHWSRHMDRAGKKADFPTIQRVMHPHASHLLGYAKPHGDIYRAFENATGFGPGDILFFDDQLDNLAMARQLGWHTAHVDHTCETAPQIWSALVKLGVVHATPSTRMLHVSR